MGGPFGKISLAVMLLVFLIGGGVKVLMPDKMDINDPAQAAKMAAKFNPKCLSNMEDAYKGIGRAPTPAETANFQPLCNCMWSAMVTVGKQANRKMSFSDLQGELLHNLSYQAAVESCGLRYPALPEEADDE